ncbi:MAG TPA: hypothetical protein VNK23_08015 [Candidatus Dormibacteraeota bacterium]|nr:hypothetical protein [Candidatus Dormibacteraeota bacterium]
MKDDQQLESPSVDALQSAIAPRAPATGDKHPKPSRFVARLRFFRAMLWVLVYAFAGIFLMSLIILGGLRLPAKIIGGALLLVLALIAATYGLQWYS